MINANRNSHVGYRRRGLAPAVLGDGNTVAWFDFAENITKDGSDFVSVWGDKSGNSNDLLQAAGTNQPLWTVDGVLFDGIDNFMQALFTFIQPEMIYIVFKQVSWGSTDRVFDGDSGSRGILSQTTASPQLSAYAGTTSATISDLAVGSFGIARVLFNGASSKLQGNEGTPVTGDFGSRVMNGLTLGASGSGLGNFSNILVAEAPIRNIADTAPNDQIIYDYLANKYSI